MSQMVREQNSNASAITRISAGVGSALIVGGSAVVAYYEPTSAGFFPVCPLFALTGFACPGCGLTRGFHALFHGDWIVALDFNLLIPIWTVVFSWVFVSLIVLAIRGKGLKMWPTNPRFMTVFGAIMLVFGVLRNVPIWPLTILFP